MKKERDIARADELGVRLYTVDCRAELNKVAALRRPVRS